MPRSKSYQPEDLVLRAMEYFWRFGFNAASIDDLVKATHVSRHGIYGDFGGKHDLFLACLAAYQDEVVTPAFGRVEAAEADLQSIADYFEFQIARAEEGGLPGPGCLVANIMTEVAPHKKDVMAAAAAHNERLYRGFLNALRNVGGNICTMRELDDLATFLVTSAQGLWSMSRSISDASVLRRYVATLLSLLEKRVSP